MEKICPHCGQSSGKKPFVAALCRDCFMARHTLYELPQLTPEQCPRCGKLRLGGKWVHENALLDTVKDKIKSPYRIKSLKGHLRSRPRHFRVDLEIELEADGQTLSETPALELDTERKLCPDCSLRSGGYHELVVQLRGDPERVERNAEKLVQKMEKKTFVSAVVRQKEGIDLHVGKKRPGLEVLHKMPWDGTYTRKLVGEKAGVKLFRTTACFRL